MDKQDTEYEVRLVTVTVGPQGEPVYGEKATTVSIQDDDGGELLEITQDEGTIKVDPEEWPAIRRAVNKMARLCR